jgi:hypothetical protein
MMVGGVLIVGSWAKMALRSHVEKEIGSHETTKRAEMLAAENARLQAQQSALRQEVEDLRSRRVRILNVQPILELGILEAECEMSKCFDLAFDKDGKYVEPTETDGVQQVGLWAGAGWGVLEWMGYEGARRSRFVGTLQVKFMARYGIDMHMLRIGRDDDKKVLLVANAEPAYLGSRGFPQTEWKGCVCLRETQSGSWLADDVADRLESGCKDGCRKWVEDSLRAGPESLSWLKVPLRNTVRHLLTVLIAPPGYTVLLVEESAPDFTPFFDYAAQLGLENPAPPLASQGLL